VRDAWVEALIEALQKRTIVQNTSGHEGVVTVSLEHFEKVLASGRRKIGSFPRDSGLAGVSE